MFTDRTEAGKALAREIESRAGDDPMLGARGDDCVVIALPRGGVPVALELARAFGAPMDIALVRKIGVPWQPELAAAAIVDGDPPQMVRNEAIIAECGLTDDDLQPIIDEEMEEIERRRALYLRGRPRPSVQGRTVFVADDGLATGATARAALKALRRQGPKALILAVPVAPPDTAARMEEEADRVVCLTMPRHFLAIGSHYARFDQLADEDVIRGLDEPAEIDAPPARRAAQ